MLGKKAREKAEGSWWILYLLLFFFQIASNSIYKKIDILGILLLDILFFFFLKLKTKFLYLLRFFLIKKILIIHLILFIKKILIIDFLVNKCLSFLLIYFDIST